MVELKIVNMGNSLGVRLPRHVLERLRVKNGGKLLLTESPDGGYSLTPYDSEFARQMRLAEQGMRRYCQTLRALAILLIALLVVVLFPPPARAQESIDVGSRRELFVDRYVIDELRGDARLELQRPKPQEVVLVTDRPWEGNTSAYFTLFQDGDLYRMYYRGSHFDERTGKKAHREVTCYAESRDGVHWTKPDLGLFEFDGSTENNIVWDGIGTHDFTPFLDRDPDCPAEVRYKALGRGPGKHGQALYAFQSPDGIHWKQAWEEPVIREGAFDSQNLAFWDPERGRYLEYHRQFRDKVRDIMMTTSTDFHHWAKPVFLEFPGAPREHLYTNAILPYERAPHILIGFPARYHPDRGSQVEPLFMSSRDARTFHRWPEAVIPVTAPRGRAGNRSNYMAWGLLKLPGDGRQYSVYATEAYYTGPDSRLRRFTYRADGFVAVRAETEGDLLTKPLRFSGHRLEVNFVTRGKGELRIELQHPDGSPIDGCSIADCHPLRGDAIDQLVTWKADALLGNLAGQPLRIRFQLRNADLYSLRFAE